jgi:hypothetical protein
LNSSLDLLFSGKVLTFIFIEEAEILTTSSTVEETLDL